MQRGRSRKYVRALLAVLSLLKPLKMVRKCNIDEHQPVFKDVKGMLKGPFWVFPFFPFPFPRDVGPERSGLGFNFHDYPWIMNH